MDFVKIPPLDWRFSQSGTLRATLQAEGWLQLGYARLSAKIQPRPNQEGGGAVLL